MMTAITGYYYAIWLILQSKGADYDSQSLLSLALYPYSFKFLVSPFLDRFYIGWMGRSRTYIIIGGYVLAIVFIAVGPYLDEKVEKL